ncbi:MAG: hypothetical protein ACRCVT_13790 [Leadbetterella sp.]
MKKIILFAALLGGIIAFPGCKSDSDPVESCASQAQKISDLSDAWGTKQTKASCEEYVNAYNEFMKSSCFKSLYTQAQQDTFISLIKSTNCSLYK